MTPSLDSNTTLTSKPVFANGASTSNQSLRERFGLSNKSYDTNLRNKLEAFRVMTNCKKSLQTTMITTYGVKQGKYSGIIQSQVTLDDLFES